MMKHKAISLNKNIQKGFTLLEIIVVVVIIGALAALAVPRYFAVVERMRAEEGKQILFSLLMAQKHFALENNGSYATNLNQMDVNFTLSSDNFISVNDSDILPGGGQLAQVRRRNSLYTLQIDAQGTISCIGAATLCSTLEGALNN